MKKLVFTLMMLAGFALQAMAYDFQQGDLLYTIHSANPPEVRVVGHVDGTSAQGELIIPETVEHEGVVYSVTIIGKNAFRGCELLTGNLALPNSVVEIKAGAFTGCSGFSGDLVIPNSVTKMNIDSSYQSTVPGSFEDCTGFDGRLFLSNSLEIIGDASGGGCFWGCVNLIGELVIPATMAYIGECAFRGCTGFTGTLVIPESVTEIGNYAFAGCTGIEDLLIPDNPFQMGIGLFNGCMSLTDVSFPEGWETIGEYTFKYCSGIQSVQLPESLVEIGQSVFSDCQNLSDVNLPDGLRKIGDDAFLNCSVLRVNSLPDSLGVIGSFAFSNCTSIAGIVVIPDKVEEVLPYAFSSCTGITQIVLGKSLRYIPELAFENTAIGSITLRAIVPPELDRRGTWHFPESLPIIVPCGTLNAYQNADGWNEFTNIHEGVTEMLTVNSADETAGTVSILKEATCEDGTVKVEALPNEGYAFMYWEANGERVSVENPYSFVLEEDTELVAHFSGTGLCEMKQTFDFYPNPAQDQLHLQYSPDVQPKHVELYDLQGRLVRSQGNTFETVDLGQLPAGTYTLRVTMQDGQTFSDMVVKE